MKLWPYDSFEIETSMSREQVLDVLRSETEPVKWFRLSRKHKTFQGEVFPDAFRISRIIHYNNSFLPIVKGSFGHGWTAGNVGIEMRLHPIASAFLVAFLGFLALGILAMLLDVVKIDRAGQLRILPMFFLFMVFFWVLAQGCFWFEARKAKKILLTILRGTESRAGGTLEPSL